MNRTALIFEKNLGYALCLLIVLMILASSIFFSACSGDNEDGKHLTNRETVKIEELPSLNIEVNEVSWEQLGVKVLTGMAACDNYLAVSDAHSAKVYFFDKDFRLIGENSQITVPGKICSANNQIYVQDAADQSIWIFDDQMNFVRKLETKIDADEGIVDETALSMIVHNNVVYLNYHSISDKTSGIIAVDINTGQQILYGKNVFNTLFDGVLVQDPQASLNNVYVLDYTNLIEERDSWTFFPQKTTLRILNTETSKIEETRELNLPEYMDQNVFKAGLIYNDQMILASHTYSSLFLFNLDGSVCYGILADLNGENNLQPYNICVFQDRLLVSRAETKKIIRDSIRNVFSGKILYMDLDSIKD